MFPLSFSVMNEEIQGIERWAMKTIPTTREKENLQCSDCRERKKEAFELRSESWKLTWLIWLLARIPFRAWGPASYPFSYKVAGGPCVNQGHRIPSVDGHRDVHQLPCCGLVLWLSPLMALSCCKAPIRGSACSSSVFKALRARRDIERLEWTGKGQTDCTYQAQDLLA